jgi:hypothetical protein
MAIIPSTDYAGQITTGDGGYPRGKAKNVSASGAGDGTPLEAGWVNDLWGFFQALLDRAGITPSGDPDEVGASDYLDAISQLNGGSTDLVRTYFDLIQAPYADDFWPSSGGPISASYSADGTRMFYLRATVVEQVDLSTAWDLSSGTDVGSTLINVEVTGARSMKWKPDGTRFWVLDTNDQVVHQYNTTVAWSVTDTVNYDTGWDAGAILLEDFAWSASGSRITTLAGGSTDTLYEYTCAAAWDLNTAPVSFGTEDLAEWDSSTEATEYLAWGRDEHFLYIGKQLGINHQCESCSVLGSATTAFAINQGTNSMFTGPGHPNYMGNQGNLQFSPNGEYALVALTDDDEIRQFYTTRVTAK